MKKLVASIHAPGRLTVLAALLAGICAPAMSSSDIVISQVFGGGGNSGSVYKNDFVELFNRGAVPVSLAGWSVQYAATGGNSWAKTSIGAVTLQPGQYFLVQEAAQGGGTTALPTPDATGTLTLAAGAGKVALVSNSTTIGAVVNPTAANTAGLMDLVGYGPATTAFETAPTTANLSATSAALRGAGGCTDTDNNSTDFVVGTPLPRNTSTALNVCASAVAPIVPTCPALSVQEGVAGSVLLSATDADSIVNGATISSGALAGIALGSFTASSAIGQPGSVSLNVNAGVASGSHPIGITFANDGGQTAPCTVNVTVQALAAVTNTIPQIQGSGSASPFANTVQTTEGVITVKTSNGFYMQDLTGDNDTATSDAIFVFGGVTNAIPGDLVRVTATVTEFTPTGGNHSITEMTNASSIITRSHNNIITPVNVVAPAADLGQYESMLVRVTNPLTVNDSSSLVPYGELTLSSGRREVPTNAYPAGSAGALALAASNAANQIVLGDRGVSNPIPFIGEGSTVRVGDTVTDLIGVLDYGPIGGGQSGFKIQPVVESPPVFSRTNARLAAPVVPAGNVKVASANVLNFFTTFTDGTDVTGATGQVCKVSCRGANSKAEFDRQLAKIVNELKAIDADVVGLMEIQNNGETAVSYLVNQLNAAIGGTLYNYVPMPPATGTDAIRVAMIYKPATLSLVGPSMSDADVVNNRPPMAQTFKAANGAKFSVIVNHLKSKGGCPKPGDADVAGNLDSGDSQGCWNANRVQQAQRLASYFIPTVVATSGDPDVLVIGDMNSHGFEDPINVLTGAGLVNELERFVRPNGMVYSYVFDGESGYLDHALATAGLNGQMAGATEWHNNADEPEIIDYNFNLGSSTTTLKPQDLYVNNAYRASDHDPVVVSLNLVPPFVDATASFKIVQSGLTMNRFTSKYSGTVSFTNTSGAAISGPVQFQLNGLSAGVTLDNKSGDHAGAPYVTISAGPIAAGATVTVTTTFSNPSKTSIVYTPQIFNGTF